MSFIMTTKDEGLEKAKELFAESLKDTRKVLGIPLGADYYAVGAWYNLDESYDESDEHFEVTYTDSFGERHGWWSTSGSSRYFAAACALVKGDKILSKKSSRGIPGFWVSSKPIWDRGNPAVLNDIIRSNGATEPVMADDALFVEDGQIQLHFITKDISVHKTGTYGYESSTYGHESSQGIIRLQIPDEVIKDIERQVIEKDLQENMASSNPDRKKLRGYITRIHSEEQAARDEVKKGIRSLSPKEEDLESPRYKRAQELRKQKRKYGSRAAIEADKALRKQNDLGNQERKGMRQKLYKRAQEAEKLKAKRQAVAKKLSEPVPERDTETQRIRDLRRDIQNRQRALKEAQEGLEKAKSTYGDLRKRFKPKPRPQPQPTPNLQPVKRPQKKAPKSFFGRLFSRGENG